MIAVFGESTAVVSSPLRKAGLFALVASTALPTNITPPTLALTLTANAPAVTNVTTVAAQVGIAPQFGESFTVQRGSWAGGKALLASYAPVVSTTASTNAFSPVFGETLIKLPQRQKVNNAFVAAIGNVGAYFVPPTLNLNLGLTAPNVYVYDFVPYLSGDNCDYATDGPFFGSQSGRGAFLLAPVQPTYSPPALALGLTAYAPTVTVSNNTQVFPPTLALNMAPNAPTLTIFGAPYITPPTLALTLAAPAPTITGGNPPPAADTNDPGGPLIRESWLKKPRDQWGKAEQQAREDFTQAIADVLPEGLTSADVEALLEGDEQVLALLTDAERKLLMEIIQLYVELLTHFE